MNKLVGFISVLVLGYAVAPGATVTYDFNTDCLDLCLGNACGTMWDGTTMNNTGSWAWLQSGGAGRVGGTTNGPVYGMPDDGFDGFVQLAFASPFCDGNLSRDVCGADLLSGFDGLDGGQSVAGFTFECDLRMGNGDPAPIGGFSVNFMRTNDPVVLALLQGDTVLQMNGRISTNGGRFSDYGNGSDISLIEEGTTTGLSIGFQMQDNGDYHIPPDAGAVGKQVPGITHDGVGLHVRVDGTVVATVPMPNGTTQQTYDQHGNPLMASDPMGTNAATDLRAVETGPYNGTGCGTNLLWVHFKMDLSTNGALNVWWKNLQVITNLPTNFLPYSGLFLIAADLRILIWTTLRSRQFRSWSPPMRQHSTSSGTTGKPSSPTPASCNRHPCRRVATLTCLTRAVHTRSRGQTGDVLSIRLVSHRLTQEHANDAELTAGDPGTPSFLSRWRWGARDGSLPGRAVTTKKA